ncbi:glycosyltransferase family 1 protein [uncultured Porphyromonas sp.]|uniref:glycosyltransferase family 4 protein n=1 Tax=uncultured Porphyromonas sp. TaxID=159274 RepID=UPI002603DC0D|nr:glycosyltransferase family 1 protein [uncultured Porphyromonas sp.]
MKKVLIDQERLRYPYCGLAYYCRCLETGLRELPTEGFKCSFYRPQEGESKDVVSFRRLHKYFNPTPLRFDLLHVTHQLQRYFPQSWSTKRLVTLHDLNFLHEDLEEHRRAKLQRIATKNLRQADAIVCISDFVRQDLEANLELFPLRKGTTIHIVHNGIFLPDEEQLRALPTEGIIPKNPYLLALGVLFDKKQQHLLIEMLRHLPEELHLVLVYSEAKSEYKARIDRLIRETGTADRIHLYEAVPHEVKDTLLYHCKALVHPSKAEGFGLPVVEAMALGKPLFLRPMTSLPEIGGEEAYYFDSTAPEDMAELVQRGLKDFEHEPRRSERLKERAQRLFSYQHMAEGYASIYRQLLHL